MLLILLPTKSVKNTSFRTALPCNWQPTSNSKAPINNEYAYVNWKKNYLFYPFYRPLAKTTLLQAYARNNGMGCLHRSLLTSCGSFWSTWLNKSFFVWYFVFSCKVPNSSNHLTLQNFMGTIVDSDLVLSQSMESFRYGFDWGTIPNLVFCCLYAVCSSSVIVPPVSTQQTGDRIINGCLLHLPSSSLVPFWLLWSGGKVSIDISC